MSGVSEDQEGLQITSPAPPPLPPKRKEDPVALVPGSTDTEGPKGEGDKREGRRVEEGGGKGRDVKIDSINDIVTDDLDEWTMVDRQMTESLSSSQQQTSLPSASTPKAQAKKKKQRWTKRRECIHHAIKLQLFLYFSPEMEEKATRKIKTLHIRVREYI